MRQPQLSPSGVYCLKFFLILCLNTFVTFSDLHLLAARADSSRSHQAPVRIYIPMAAELFTSVDETTGGSSALEDFRMERKIADPCSGGSE